MQAGTNVLAVEVHQYSDSSSDLHFELALRATRSASSTPSEVVRKYYYADGQRVALREDGTLYYFLADQLGSATVTTSSTGTKVAELRYKPWGENRDSGYPEAATPTDYRFTGQREAGMGLYFFRSRWYDPQLGRFLQADTLIPEAANPLSWDRFSYVINNPLRYIDPFGHRFGAPEDIMPKPKPPKDPVNLTDWGENMEELYNEIKTTEGWWNEIYGYTITIHEFVQLLLSFELAGLDEAYFYEYEQFRRDLGEAAGHWFATNCAANAGNVCPGPTNHALLNWLGGNFQSAQGRYINYKMGLSIPDLFKEDKPDPLLAQVAFNGIVNPADSEWITWEYPSSHPTWWGNGSMFTRPPSVGEYLWMLPGGDPWYLVTRGQGQILKTPTD